MRKIYIEPEIKLVKFSVEDVVLASPVEETFATGIGSDQGATAPKKNKNNINQLY